MTIWKAILDELLGGVERSGKLLGDAGLTSISEAFLATTLEHTGCFFQQCPPPSVDHRRMNPEPACQIGHRPYTCKRFKRHPRLELRRTLLPFRHL